MLYRKAVRATIDRSAETAVDTASRQEEAHMDDDGTRLIPQFSRMSIQDLRDECSSVQALRDASWNNLVFLPRNRTRGVRNFTAPLITNVICVGRTHAQGSRTQFVADISSPQIVYAAAHHANIYRQTFVEFSRFRPISQTTGVIHDV